jgi:hypothetical protein
MLSHMRTTINLPDDLMSTLKRRAATNGMTVTSMIERAIRRTLDDETQPRKRFRLRDGSVGGEGLTPEFAGGDWSRIREAIYEGQGG